MSPVATMSSTPNELKELDLNELDFDLPRAPSAPAAATDLDDLLQAVDERIAGQRLPVATYRLQFTAAFTLKNAQSLVPYLAALGITDLYASPLLQAREGSQSGYDVVDYSAINTELGSLGDLESLSAALRTQRMGLVMDVVPNHMGTASVRNRWWLDVLENGPASPYAGYFDIDWTPPKPDLTHKVLLPVLGEQFGKVLEDGQLKLALEDGSLWITYFSARFPLAPESYALVLASGQESLQQKLPPDSAELHEYLSILTAIKNLPPFMEAAQERAAERHREKEVIKRRLKELVDRSPVVAAQLAETLKALNGTPGTPRSFDRLDELLGQQPYRLAYWRVAAEEINYRRFFDINELAAICVEQREVFEDIHRFAFDLVDRGLVDGLRIDHPDGLFDPRGYLWQLQEKRFLQLARRQLDGSSSNSSAENRWAQFEPRLRERFKSQNARSTLARPLYVVVEKILEPGEPLPEDWPVHGTVGYEFLNKLSGIFVSPSGEKPISATYTRFTGESLDFKELAYRCKRLIARINMASELTVLGYRLDRISERNRWTRDFTLSSLTRALQEIAACFSVYRTYITEDHVADRDRRYLEAAVARAKRRNPSMSASIFDFVRDLLLWRHGDQIDEDERQQRIRLAGKFQQLTGPIMAKAVEDTAFYRYNRLVSLNEVGGEPERFGNEVAAFHELNRQRLPRLSRGMSSTSTHDTKRSEDTRARINVLSEVPKEWRQRLMRWSRLNRRFRSEVDGQPAPSQSDEYLLYQSLIGIWPEYLPRGEERARLQERVQQYMLKVAREAKVNSSWISPDESYEQALLRFIADIFQSDKPRSFLADLDRFAAAVREHGWWNSLSQVLLKIASPGVPDFYQGCELWSLALVDPDNRQPVDFELRTRLLEELLSQADPASGRSRQSLLADLLASRRDGRIKLLVTCLALRARRDNPVLFTEGQYIPLVARGQHADCVVALARHHGERTAIAVAPRLTVQLCGLGGPPPIGEIWGDTAIELPPEFQSASLIDSFSGEQIPPTAGAVPVSQLLAQFPAALAIG
jgi:(1->4)-alpha-D-glucan 1-alpha-D-glucosylmutase